MTYKAATTDNVCFKHVAEQNFVPRASYFLCSILFCFINLLPQAGALAAIKLR